jgi:hypothetical protein
MLHMQLAGGECCLQSTRASWPDPACVYDVYYRNSCQQDVYAPTFNRRRQLFPM